MNICIIPARGGSKRIPRKNIKLFLGKPIISYAIEVALKCGIFDHIVLSTDDKEIATVGKYYGAEVPFMRPSVLASDTASTDEVLQHAIEKCIEIYGDFEKGCCLYPTNPLLTSEDVLKGFQILDENKAATSFPLVKYDYPIEQAFKLLGNKAEPLYPELILSRSQDLREYYHDSGMFYCFDTCKLLEKRELFSDNTVSFEVPRNRCQDINTIDDWLSAEEKYINITTLT